MLLKLEHGVCFVERREPLANGEVRNIVMDAWVQTVDDVLDEVVALLLIGEMRSPRRSAMASCACVHEHDLVALDEASKFSIEVDGVCVLVLPEQIMDAAREGVHGVFIGGNGGKKVGGDAIVKPLDDGTIVLNPVRISSRRSGAIDVVAKLVLAKDGGEYASPSGEVGVIEV